MSALQEVPCHHKKMELCFTRPAYRAPNKPNAIKVYTVSQESCYLMIQHVPAINLGSQLARLLNNSGTLIRFEKVNDIPCEDFTEVYLAKYTTLASARYIKKKYDDHAFYGSQLHLTYAPEQETVDETCEKLEMYRRSSCKVLNSLASQVNKSKEKTTLRNSFKPNSADSRSSHSGSILLKNNKTRYRDKTRYTDKSVNSDCPPDSPLQSDTKSCEIHITRISMPTNFNITSNPPTQHLFCKTSKFRPVPRQVKLRQTEAERHIGTEAERHIGRQKGGWNKTVKNIGGQAQGGFEKRSQSDERCHEQLSSKNLLISSELLNRTGGTISVQGNLNSVGNCSNAELSKEVKTKARRRI